MRKAMEMVAEFHRKHGAPVRDRLATTEEIEARRELRMELIHEEASELKQALGLFRTVFRTVTGRLLPEAPPDITAIADALADLAYVTIGAALEWGIPLDRVFAEVHRSNMTKTVGLVRGDGKILKGDGYEPPRIAEVLSEPQRTDSTAADVMRVCVALFGGLRVELASDDAMEWMRAAAREAIRLGADPSKAGKP